ncbi:hypothetical protein KIH27_21440 [Mycobacterium sp. M1]|uniref:PE domain-containing protein n=1 Tax=Mycolicibacter acidiphilus TaxID=2835306 RepID=A0ABS5RPE1_9MYCO|nr:hypothetical protein [Mycolicibacter acidiphilus]MBS9536152.1 hypothetical protein [Mycolicibacter acidiphilus]
MTQTLRPYVTSGLVIVGVGLVAAPVATSHLPQLEHRLALVEQRAVALAATDFFAPYTELFSNTAANLKALSDNSVNFFGLLEHIFTNPQQALAGIPDALNVFTNPLPTIDAHLLPFPAEIGVQLPTWLNMLLADIGPLVTVFNAMQELFKQIFDFSDPTAAFAALIGAPATLLNAFLNGHDSLTVGGFDIPLFNGILTAGQSMNINVDVGTLVNAAGLGDQTLTGLLTQAGIGDKPLDGLLTGLLDQVGFGHLTPVDLLNQFGPGEDSLSSVLIGLLNSSGVGNPTMADLLGTLGGFDQSDSVASLLIALLNSSEVGVGNPTIGGLLLDFLGPNQTVGGLLSDLLGAQGNDSLASLVDPSLTVGGLLSQFLGNPPLTDFFDELGIGNLTLGSVIGDALGSMGNDTLLDLLNNGFLGAGVTGNTGLVALLNDLIPPGMTLSDLLNGNLGSQTLGELLAQAPAPAEIGGVAIPAGTSLADIQFTQLLTLAGIGDTPLAELSPENASLINKIGNPTLNALLGTNTVGQTLDNLGLGHATIDQLLQAMGINTVTLGSLLDGLGNLSGNVTLEQFFTDLGFNPTLSEIVDRLLSGLGVSDTTLNSIFSDLGMDNVGLGNLIDALGLDHLGIQAMLNDLGLNNIDLNMFIDRIGLGGIPIATLLSDLGLDDKHLDEVINSLLGTTSIGSVLGGLGLDQVHLETFITDLTTSVLGNPTLGSMLGDLGLGNNDLDTIIGNLGIGGVTINSLLGDLGLGNTDIDTILSGLGLSDLGLVAVNSTFFGQFSELLNNIPQQIAEALGYTG